MIITEPGGWFCAATGEIPKRPIAAIRAPHIPSAIFMVVSSPVVRAPGALLGWGDPEVGAFKRIEIKDKTEIVSLIGDISSPNGKPYVHVHMVVGSSDGTTKAGHLLEAHIAPVGELTVVATSFAAN